MISELEKVVPIWPQMSTILTVPHDDETYNYLVTVLDSLVDEVQENENHELAGLMEVVGNLVDSYETQNFKIGESSPITVLKELMEQNLLSQGDLSEVGSQGVVSEILKGKRQLNVRQIKALSERFGVSPMVFL